MALAVAFPPVGSGDEQGEPLGPVAAIALNDATSEGEGEEGEELHRDADDRLVVVEGPVGAGGLAVVDGAVLAGLDDEVAMLTGCCGSMW